MPATPELVEPEKTFESPTLDHDECMWLAGRLEELVIPTPQGKLLAAQIQVKVHNAIVVAQEGE